MSKNALKTTIIPALTICALILTPTQTHASWPMAGASPDRSGWVDANPERTQYNLKWTTPIQNHIPQKVQPISDDTHIYVSTADGLIVLDKQTGALSWSYPTSHPLGNTPTLDPNTNTLYIPGFDKYLHAVDTDGNSLWKYQAQAGFASNPLVISDSYTQQEPLVIVPNRDGYIYAIAGEGSSSPGSLKWRHFIGGPLTQSAAYANGTIFIGAPDGKAYAINIADGARKWQSAQLPTAGFDTWWPVVYKNYVVLSGNPPYSMHHELGKTIGTPHTEIIRNLIWDDYASKSSTDSAALIVDTNNPNYAQVPSWPTGTPYMDMRFTNNRGTSNPPISTIYGNSSNQHLRAVFVLDIQTGQEVMFSSNGESFYAPLMITGDNSGSRLPPIVNKLDNTLYFHGTKAAKGSWFPQSGVLGWTDTHPAYLSITHHKMIGGNGAFPNDEPLGLTSSGPFVYFSMIDDRLIGSVDITVPLKELGFDILTTTATIGTGYDNGQLVDRSWRFGGATNTWKVSGYDDEELNFRWQLSQLGNGDVYLYYNHRETPGPAFSGTDLILNRSNAIVVLSPGNTPQTSTPNPAASITNSNPALSYPSQAQLATTLESEIIKIINAGTLKFSNLPLGLLSHTMARMDTHGVYFYDSPFDLHVVLARSLPYLNSQLQEQVKQYARNQHAQFPVWSTTSMGNATGTNREYWPPPPELGSKGPASLVYSFNALSSANCDDPNDPNDDNTCQIGWYYAPYNLYTTYIYVRDLDNSIDPATALANALSQNANMGITVKDMFDPTKNPRYPTIAKDYEHPHMFNAYIAGLYGYKGLLELSGKGSGDPEWDEISNRLNSLLQDRASGFHTDIRPFINDGYDKHYYVNLISWNFRHMVPELAAYLRANADFSDPQNGIDSAISEYEKRYPYWFIPLNQEAQGEGTSGIPHHYHDLFLAKAWLQQRPYEELASYIDAPGYKIGDMYYIDNIIAALESASTNPPPTKTGDIDNDSDVDIFDYNLLLEAFGSIVTGLTDLDNDNDVDVFDFSILVSHLGATGIE